MPRYRPRTRSRRQFSLCAVLRLAATPRILPYSPCPDVRGATSSQDDIDAYMKKEGSAEAGLEKLQRLYQAFKFIEQRLAQKKQKLKAKTPEIAKTHSALVAMEEQSKTGEPLVTHYELAQSVYAKAKINVHESDKVCLWLGANVMLEYPRAEAIDLLAQQVADAKTALATTIDDMGFLRDQITTTEVNMARVFNWDVKDRRDKKEKAEKGEAVDAD